MSFHYTRSSRFINMKAIRNDREASLAGVYQPSVNHNRLESEKQLYMHTWINSQAAMNHIEAINLFHHLTCTQIIGAFSFFLFSYSSIFALRA